MDTEKQAVDIDGLLDELLAPRFTQSSPTGRSNEDANIYHSGSQVGVPFVLPNMNDDDDDDEDYDDEDDEDEDDVFNWD
jgi:hypothetical protein